MDYTNNQLSVVYLFCLVGNTGFVAGALPEERVAWPLVHQRWQAMTFLHWAYDPADVQRLLPPELQVHTYDGLAWVGLTPFLLSDFHPPGLPAVPGLSTFPETNIRTYVLDRNGVDGLWFLSVEADELATVVGARILLQVPYHWAAMSVEAGDTVTYRSRRRWPPAVGHDIVVVPGSLLMGEQLAERDHFLTGRWRAFTKIAGCVVTVPVEHQPWPLWSARVDQLDEDLLTDAGLPAPQGEPLVHYSPGVDTRFGPPRWSGLHPRW
ncbi:MAG: DUF2071 domain-containing protein [Actinomycetota bacterium]|nr:DUF2071 domain-containing protein [Actinomycetota bacterium]